MYYPNFKSTILKTVFSIFFGLLFINIPFVVHSQKNETKNTFESNVLIKEDVVFDQPVSSNYLESSNARTSRGPRQPPISSPPTQFEIAGQNCVKISIKKNDWYYVSAQQLQAAGFNISSNSANWQLYLDGVQTPIQVNADGSIEFYGIGADKIYSDTNVYYLVYGNSVGNRIPQITSNGNGQLATIDNFAYKIERKDRNYYSSAVLNGETENWFSHIISPTAISTNINVAGLSSSGNASIILKLQGITNFEHLVNVRINGYDLGVTSYANKAYHQVEVNVPLNVLSNGSNEIVVQAVASISDYSFLDSVTIKYPRKFEALNDRLHFTVPTGEKVNISGFSSPNIKVFEITNQKPSIQYLVNTETMNGTYGFKLSSANTDREFIAFIDSAFSNPLKIEQNKISNWNASTNQADFLIITSPDLLTFAQNLATRRESQSLQTKVVLTDDIADEFGFGTASPQSIRDFLQVATTSWSRQPKFVLLFGDSTYDYKNYQGFENRNIVPTKLIETFDMETSSDGWFVDFDNNGAENIAIGRLPVANALEAEKVIQKIVRYETQSSTTQKSAVLVADNFFEILNGELQALLPSNINSRRIERMSMTDAQMRQEIVNQTNQNPTFVSYMGHATTNVWTSAGIFTPTEVQSLQNQKLPFYMMMSCLNGYTHNAQNASLSESLVLADNGAIAVWASSGSTYASGQIQMGQDVVRLLFPQGKKLNRLGDVVRTAKESSNDMDARRTWQLIGDPTLFIQ